MSAGVCLHDDVEPVEVRDRTSGKTIVVATICRDCLDRLPAQWGCPDCEWVEVLNFCDVVPRRLPVQPCERHTLSMLYGA